VLLEDNFINYSLASFEKNISMALVHSNFTTAIFNKLRELGELEQQMIDRINEEREAIMKGMEDMVDIIVTIKGFGSMTHYSENYIFTNRNYLLLQGYQRQLEDINEREKVLGQEESVFPALVKLEQELRPYYQLWNMAYDLTNRIFIMKGDPIHSLNYQELKDTLTEYHRELQRLTSIFTSAKNGAAVNIIETLAERISDAQEKLWVVRAFTLEGVVKKEAIRKEILSTIFQGKEPKFTEMTLEDLLGAGVGQHKDYVIANAEKAERIWRLEQRIAAIVNDVKQLEFVFSEQRSVPIIEQPLLLALACAFHEQLELMDAIKDTREAQYIQKKVSNIHSKLKFIEDTLHLMARFQLEFFPLQQLVTID
jgi:uncharacterized protein (UPF0335 family)